MVKEITSAGIVNDLIRIHDERIAEYLHLLHDANLTSDIKTIFESIIEESLKYSQQLKEIVQVSPESHGSIYKLWLSGKEPVADKKKKMILANTYSVAISMITDEKIRRLLEDHQQGLKNLHARIRQYYHAQ